MNVGPGDDPPPTATLCGKRGIVMLMPLAVERWDAPDAE